VRGQCFLEIAPRLFFCVADGGASGHFRRISGKAGACLLDDDGGPLWVFEMSTTCRGSRLESCIRTTFIPLYGIKESMARVRNLFDASAVGEIKGRTALLRPDSERQWGRMNAAQAVAHCSAGLEWAVGDRIPPRMFLGRIIGRFVKPLVMRNDEPMRRNSPTARDLIVQDERDLRAERERLSGLIDRFAAGGPEGCTSHPHSFFGRLTPDEWAILMYKHLDHHLRQFGV
jgi:hypothetical protein